MASASYSFLDVAVLDAVRGRFAAGDALVILSTDLEEVIWANGAGATLFGYPHIMAAIGAPSRLGLAARRQISSTAGFPAIGRDRAILVRLNAGLGSQAARLLASQIELPDGESAILLAAPGAAAGGRSAVEIARRAIGGFGEAGHFVAFVTEDGAIEASSEGFDALGIDAASLRSLASGLAEGGIVKRLIGGPAGRLPAGMARLTRHSYLVVVIDEAAAAERPKGDGDGPPSRRIAPEGQPDEGARATEAAAGPGGGAPEAPTAMPAPRKRAEAAAGHDGWYFGGPGDRAERNAASISRESDETAAGNASADAERDKNAATGPEPGPVSAGTEAGETGEASPRAKTADRSIAPVRFVWRTDAEGRFSQISPEFAAVVGAAAADVVGRRFRDVAEALGLDPGGEIAGLLARRDTWSGRSVLWPAAESDRRIPVDLAALPIYDRNRNFEGFRGFGVARAGEAVERADAPGSPTAAAGAAEAQVPRKPDPGPDGAALAMPQTRAGPEPKVIRLAEHRQPAGEKGLSSGERIAFQQIAERLKRESGLEAGDPAAAESRGEGIEAPAADPASGRSEPPELRSSTQPPAGWPAAEGDEIAPAPDARSEGRAEPPEPPLRASGQPRAGFGRFDTAPAGRRPPGKTAGSGEEPTGASPAEHVRTRPPASPGPMRREARPDGGRPVPGEARAPMAVRPSSSEERPAASPAKPARSGLSLLDFARWDEGKSRATPPQEDGDDQEGEPAPDADAPLPGMADPASPAGAVQWPGEAQDRSGGGTMPASADVLTESPGARRTEPPAPGEAAAPDRIQEASRPPAEDAAGASGDVPDGRAMDGTEGRLATEAGEMEDKPASAHPSPAAEPRRNDTSILEKLPVPVLVHSGDALHYGNAEFLALTGYASVAELAEAGGIGALFAECWESEEPPSDRQLRLRHKSGEEFPVKAVLRSAPWNGGKALLLVLARSREPVAQSAAVADLEARIAELRTIIDTATDGVVLISLDGAIRSISRPAEALFGFDSHEVAGKPFTALFAIESQRAARDYLQGMSDHGVASVLNDGREVIGREAEGRFIPLFMTIGRLPADGGYCAVVRDITQWKRAEEDLTQARALAERASAHKSEFLARISHEIRTPLNAIIGFSELMVDEKFGPVTNDRYRDYLRDINRSGNHVLDLVNDLLDISKIEAGQQDMANEPVSLNEALAETVALMQPQANRERVIIRSSFASRLPEVVADMRSVRQIALNILSNAIRYTQAGGQVIVSTAYEPSGEVVMRVRDTGIGMSQAEIEQAMKPFKQINSLRRARGDGTGLGLPLTKAMVEANRAKFSISSQPGEGTLVEISFPSTRVLAE